MKNIGDTLTKQLMEYLALGIYQVDEKLPSVRDLSVQYHVNPNTIAKVYMGLEEKGYIYALPAKGYYVAKTSDELKQATLETIQPIIKELCILTKLANITIEEVIDLLKKEEKHYDRS